MVGATNTMVFEHETQPHAVKPNKTKYRDDETPLPLSSDPRVIRGSTTALSRKVAASKRGMKKTMSQSVDMSEFGRQLPRPTYEFEVKGHVGADVDLSHYLVAKDDGILPQKKTVVSQTDAFKPRPPSPAFRPRKTGIDGETQVEDVRELFDFDTESAPIVDVIVAKTLEQAIFEVRHEEELLALETVAAQFQQEMVVEKQWQQQREAETLAELKTHAGEMKRASDRKTAEGLVRRVVAGSACMRQILPGIFENAVEDLYRDEVWFPPDREDVEINVWPVARDFLRVAYRANGDCRKIVEEIALEAVRKYEELTHVVKPRREERCVLLQIRPKEVAVVEEGTPAPKDIEAIKIYGDVSIDSILKQMRQLCAEREIPPFELTVAMLQSFFETVTGRRICRDGAIINFSEWLPDHLTYEV